MVVVVVVVVVFADGLCDGDIIIRRYLEPNKTEIPLDVYSYR